MVTITGAVDKYVVKFFINNYTSNIKYSILIYTRIILK
jgi:hypothetical protein